MFHEKIAGVGASMRRVDAAAHDCLMLRFASLASGSGGNCLVADADGTRVLLDCGLNLRCRRTSRASSLPTSTATMRTACSALPPRTTSRCT